MDFSEAEQILMTRDEVLRPVILHYGPLTNTPRHDYFESLSESIVSQQLSVKASDTIFRRFRHATNLDPVAILTLSDEEYRTLGISGQKTRYLKDLALHFANDPAVFNHLEQLDNESVIAELTLVKGIGRWTAQMFLMFTLDRPDIFAPDDLGLQNAIQRLYQLPAKPTSMEACRFAERWAPYRTTASRYLWKSLDNAPIMEDPA